MLEAIGTLSIVVLMLFLAYFVSKNIGRVPFVNNPNMSKNMKVIDRMYLSQDKALYIIKIANEYFLISSSNNAITLLKELNKEDVIEPQINENANQVLDFKTILEKMKKGEKDK